MLIDIATIFPGMFESPLADSIIKRAIEKGCVEFHFHDIRDHALDKHHSVDDTPYGGGAGMVMKASSMVDCVEAIPRSGKSLRILMTPQGEPFSQRIASELAAYDQLIIICSRYEGIDERARTLLAERELSIGDYVLSGGEIPAMAVCDAVIRLLPGVLGNSSSLAHESFEDGLLEYPQYTRPEEYRGMRVPDVLLSGHHAEIEKWRRAEAEKRTEARRPDLLVKK